MANQLTQAAGAEMACLSSSVQHSNVCEVIITPWSHVPHRIPCDWPRQIPDVGFFWFRGTRLFTELLLSQYCGHGDVTDIFLEELLLGTSPNHIEAWR